MLLFFFLIFKKIWVKKKFGLQTLGWDFFGVKKILFRIFFGSKEFGSEIFLGRKKLSWNFLGVKKNWVGNYFGSKKCGSEIFLGQKNVGRNFFWSEICFVLIIFFCVMLLLPADLNNNNTDFDLVGGWVVVVG